MDDELFKKEKVLECARRILEKVENLDSYGKNGKGRFETLDGTKKYLDIKNGIYFFYDGKRKKIVRVGTHKADGGLKRRISKHFGKNDASIFRERVGMAMSCDSQVKWNEALDAKVSEYINKFEIKIIGVEGKGRRLDYENRIIATLSWAGFFSREFRKPDEVMKNSPDGMIGKIGMWLKDGMFDEPVEDLREIEKIFSGNHGE